jgi:hypothetical protein
MNCSQLATRHQPRHRRMFSSSVGNMYPSDGFASSCPVMGETILGMCMPMPMPLSRM